VISYTGIVAEDDDASATEEDDDGDSKGKLTVIDTTNSAIIAL